MIVEIKGVKMEFDERVATTIEHLKVGDKVKVLKKTFNGYEVYPGVVVGFSNFKTLPTVEIFAIKSSYSITEMEMIAYNEKCEHEVVKCVDELPAKNSDIESWFEREILKKETEIEDLKARREYFRRWFGKAANDIN